MAESATRPDDPFESLLGLEEQYYNEGYTLGVADGSRSGRTEGRLFGLERSFEKFAAMGALAGRSTVWEARLPPAAMQNEAIGSSPAAQPRNESHTSPYKSHGSSILSIAPNHRLEKHIQTLSALTEADSLSTQNTEDAVSNFDDRLKRAEGKEKVISKIIRELPLVVDGSAETTGRDSKAKQNARKQNSNIEDFNASGVRS